MHRAKRVKRDSVQNIYNQCKISGNCPEDVVNKVEQTTLADRLLKILGSIVYFGGLGIGTGRGTGGSTGYTPLGAGSGRVGAGGTVIRPTVPVDPIGPVDILPIDSVDPAASSIVPLSEGGLPDGAVVELEPGGPDLGAGDIEILTETDPISDVTGRGGHPSISTTDTDVAVIDVTPAPAGPRRTPTFSPIEPSHVRIQASLSTSAEPPNINIFIDSSLSGQAVSVGEEIPLQDIPLFDELEIEEPGPRTSTPRQVIERAYTRARELYNRRVAQVQTRNVDFLSRPSRLVQFEFENPAFAEEDVSLAFQQDLQQIAAAPDADFQDVIRLGRPQLSETGEGRIRYSRAGRRGTIRTRSGVQIGQHVHFYYDFSTIENADAIELQPLGEVTGDLTLIDAQAESSFVDSVAVDSASEHIYSDEALLDPYVESFDNSHLVLSVGRRTDSFTVPSIPPGISLKVFVDDYGADLIVSYPQSQDHTIPHPLFPFGPVEPVVVFPTSDGSDYLLHPSLLKRRRRKRRYSDTF
ncbi:L2 [Macaca mulatta papillomavirus 4]|uniref:Minor capsid protein L2 n=1 Tax=Macaca mulatta papillomavirus 4 TaxID=2294152 RepID=A0A385AGZ9_9PAPI|nr:L2 [Macaca mulatta papillomavirus 4]AXN57299.1 L2 [Macaca mulatta papillomavirus 4]